MRPAAVENPLPGVPPLPLLRLLFEHWSTLHGGLRLPPPAAFDILDVPRLFGHLHLIDVIGDPARFRFRLFGTTIAEVGGRDLTGRWVDDIVPTAWKQAVIAAFQEPLRMRLPCYSRWDMDGTRQPLTLHRLACPMSTDGLYVDRLIVGVEPVARPR